MLGGARRNRTDDLFNAIEALSQLSYGPTFLEAPLGEGVFRSASPPNWALYSAAGASLQAINSSACAAVLLSGCSRSHAVAAAAFRGVERLVGPPHQRVGIGVFAPFGDTDGGGDRNGLNAVPN